MKRVPGSNGAGGRGAALAEGIAAVAEGVATVTEAVADEPLRRGLWADAEPPREELERLIERMLELLGEDPTRTGLRRTPARVAASLRHLTSGYGVDPREAIGGGLFEERHDSMVLVRDIEIHSLCEHHMLPFHGHAHIAYVPDGRIVGLSKLARLADVFARRLQVQERLTDDIARALDDVVKPRGVGVIVEATHTCMVMRGVAKQNATTVTSAMRGIFRTCPMTRNEFLRLGLRRQD